MEGYAGANESPYHNASFLLFCAEEALPARGSSLGGVKKSRNALRVAACLLARTLAAPVAEQVRWGRPKGRPLGLPPPPATPRARGLPSRWEEALGGRSGRGPSGRGADPLHAGLTPRTSARGLSWAGARCRPIASAFRALPHPGVAPARGPRRRADGRACEGFPGSAARRLFRDAPRLGLCRHFSAAPRSRLR